MLARPAARLLHASTSTSYQATLASRPSAERGRSRAAAGWRLGQHVRRIQTFDPTNRGPQPTNDGTEESHDDSEKRGGRRARSTGNKGDSEGGGGSSGWSRIGAILESAASTGAGIALFAVAGMAYHYGYKWDVLRKMHRAFEPGFDPVLELAGATRAKNDNKDVDIPVHPVNRKEQDYIDDVVQGKISGEYLLILGPKGVGKSSLLIDAAIKIHADGFALCELHEDPEVFRLRLGKALEFEYNEDSFAGLFQRRDPREAGPILDIERALNKLEKVAIRYRRSQGRPLVLVLNNTHFIHDDEAGHALLHMLQQRAESWAQSGVLTIVMTSDDFHIYSRLKKSATRMHVVSIRDLTPAETHVFLRETRKREGGLPAVSEEETREIWNIIGGRMSYLAKVAKMDDMKAGAEDMVNREKGWLKHKLGLIPDHDDDVMDEQKVSACSMTLFQEFSKLADEADAKEAAAIAAGETIDVDKLHDIHFDYGRTREIMTRPDYIPDLDHQNILNIDPNFAVRPDSRLILSVFRAICAEEGFEDKLNNVKDRIDAIESLHRTAELTVKKGEADLGGALRLRVGSPLSFAEEEEDDDDKDNAEDAEKEDS